jgi:hypothetical protein
VSAPPTTAYPVPSPPPPAAYYPPPAYQAPHGYSPVSGYPATSPYPTVDPVTGVPYSDKSKVLAGLLQLLPGFFMGIGGIGRLYAGNTNLGVMQIILSVVGFASLICGVFLIFPLLIFFGLWVWFWVDGIMMLVGRPVDGMGRPLRP